MYYSDDGGPYDPEYPEDDIASDGPTGNQYSWWSDPDNPPPAWMLDGNQQPTVNPGDGRYWNWAGDHWEARDAPRYTGGDNNNNNTTTPPPGGNDYYGYLTEPYLRTPPAWRSSPAFTPPTFVAPPPFSYQEFVPPTADSIYADPSYQFRFNEGRRALGAHRASTGTYMTGGAIKDFTNYGQNAASQEYGNIYNRAVDTHNLGLNQALGTYATNYGVSRDVFDRLYEGSRAAHQSLVRDNELMNQRDFDAFLADYDIFERNRRRVGDYLFQAAELGG